MTSELNIDKTLADEEIYKQLTKQLEYLIDPNDKIISALSNFTAALKQSFDKISWVGFYILSGEKLFLGPFQGNYACTEIHMGSGVCGTSALKKQTVIVDDVNNFPGHIACDSGSRSEIVVPFTINDKVWGVLDIDSYGLASFNDIDKKYLEQYSIFLISRLELDKFVFT